MIWRRETRNGNAVKAAVVVLVGLVVLMAAGMLVRGYRLREWVGVGRFSVLDLANARIESVDPISKEGTRLVLPKDLVIETAEGRGSWRLDALGELGEKYGEKWITISVGDFLGIQKLVSKTQMSVWDKLEWAWTVRLAKWREVDLDKSVYVANQVEVDKVEQLGLGEIWENNVREYFVSTELASEQKAVEVYNSTDAAGIAGKMARILDIAGVRVDRVASVSEEGVKKCKLVLPDQKEGSAAARYIVGVWGCEVGQSDESAIKLIVGEEMALRYRR